jgi:hypothetical protein
MFRGRVDGGRSPSKLRIFNKPRPYKDFLVGRQDAVKKRRRDAGATESGTPALRFEVKISQAANF